MISLLGRGPGEMCEYVHIQSIHSSNVLNTPKSRKKTTINQEQNEQINRDILLKCNVGLQQKETRATHTIAHMHLKHNVE